MSKGSHGSWALALVLSQAVWLPPGVPSASAQALPPDFISPNVPHDVAAGSSATPQQLALFAWQEFIALNWTALVPTSVPGGVRGRPNTALDTDAGFLGIAPDSNGNFPLVVWQTYRHKNELFPYGGPTDTQFDSPTPTYKYAPTAPTPATGGPIPSFTLFNNLDEASQIGLANMYAYATTDIQPSSTTTVLDPTTLTTSPAIPGPATGTRVAYEAKVNRAVFTYLVNHGYTVPGVKDPVNGFPYTALKTALTNTMNNLGTYGGICSQTDTTPIVMLPCGGVITADDPTGEGAIEIKAAWRQLGPKDTISHFFTRNVIFYTGPQGNQRYNNAVWGLVALHIIHKTKSFPAFVFATWEQVDNYVDDTPADPNPENIAFQNLPIKDSATVSVVNAAVTRAHAIPQYVQDTNDAVHAAFTDPTTGNPKTVWQYYKLVGVQATPENQPAANAPADDLSYYYLANIMVETNQTLQNFFGHVRDNGLPGFFENVYLNGASASPFVMGGCQGCHGFQGQSQGGDMSVLVAGNGPNAQQAESIDAPPAASTRTVIHRDRGLVGGDGHTLRKFELSRTRVPAPSKPH